MFRIMASRRISSSRCYAAVVVLIAASCGGSSAESEDVPPNVILISLDTLRYDHCGFNGYERDTTPFLDRFAKQCVAFDRAYTTMSWTLIAHMSMVTGLYPTQHGVMEAELSLSPEFPTLAERLAEEGYTNVGVHYPGWLDRRFGFGRGFTTYESAPNAREAERELDAGLKNVRPGWPYFMFIHLFDIHSGDLVGPSSTMYNPPPPFDEFFMPGAAEKLAGVDMKAWWDEPAAPTPEQLEAIKALYDGGIRYTDSMLESWFTEWESKGLLDNTIVIITSDHGEGLRQRLARFGGHGDLNEEGLRIPMLVRLPGGERAGERIDSLVSMVDIVPTVLDLAGFDADPRLPGRSMLGEARPEDEWVFAARSNIRAAVRRDRKVIYRDMDAKLMFDLSEDPQEQTPYGPGQNRERFLAEGPALLEEALAQLNDYFSPPDPRNVGELDESTRDDLKALGYGGEVGGD